MVYILIEKFDNEDARIVDVFANEEDAKTRRTDLRREYNCSPQATHIRFTIEPHKVIE